MAAADVLAVSSARDSAGSDDLFADSGAGARTAGPPASSSGTGGGLLGGVGSTVGGIAGSAPAVVGGVVNSASVAVSDTARPVLGTAGGTLRGLSIANSVSGSAGASTTLTAAGRDVRIEKGAVFQLRTTGN